MVNSVSDFLRDRLKLTTYNLRARDPWVEFVSDIDGDWRLLRITLTDGTVLEQNRRELADQEIDPNIKIGEDGSLLLIVTGVLQENGSTMSLDYRSADWGTNWTYLPADRIARVSISVS